ncbi:hypothetical protein ACN27F_23340 [Solwaraspora sp. WMMB335]|uniref:hypothetical protein n=1 Tax=Solwaraspora sp. WMMB335 TaxID=3404118 RepID=UPI003B963E36
MTPAVSRPRSAAVLTTAILLVGLAACSPTGPSVPAVPSAGRSPGSPAIGPEPSPAGAVPTTVAAPGAVDDTSVGPYPTARTPAPDARVPTVGAVDLADPTAVATAWAIHAYSYDTLYDATPHNAVLRATRYLTPEAAAVEHSYMPYAAPGARWNAWAAHEAWTSVQVTVGNEPHPPDTGTTAYRQLIVEGIAHGRDGWTGPGPHVVLFFTLDRDLWTGWLVAEVRAYVE